MISPDNNGSGDKDASFVWKKLSDLDGDPITYYLYVCPGGVFDNCEPRQIVIGSEYPNARYAGGLGASGMALLLLGFGYTGGARRALLVIIAAITLTGSAALIACGSSGSSGSNGIAIASCSAAGAETLCREKLNLAAGVYQWKVEAKDGREGQIESEVRNFTVN